MLNPMKKVVPKLAQRRQGWRTFRRTVGSLLVKDGLSLYKVAKILGHRDTRITEKHYAHLAPEEAAEELERL